MNRKKDKLGFTLIELLITIVIIGILAVISIATFEGYKEKARLAKAQSFASGLDKEMMIKMIEAQDRPFLILNLEEGSGTASQDLSGRNFDIADIGTATWTTNSPFEGGNALDLNESQVVQTIPAPYITGLTDYGKTVSMWIYFKDEMPTSEKILFHAGWRVSITAAQKIRFYSITGTAGKDMAGTTTTLSANKWHHVVGTFIKTGATSFTTRIYIDGELAEESASDGTRHNAITQYALGHSSHQPDIILDRIRIWPDSYEPN